MDREHCQPFASDCQIRAATDLLSHTWDPVVLSALRAGPVRRAELLPWIAGLSDKVLTDSLRRLTASALIEKAPPGLGDAGTAVFYRLTGLGESFVEGPLRTLALWAVDHADALAGETAAPGS